MACTVSDEGSTIHNTAEQNGTYSSRYLELLEQLRHQLRVAALHAGEDHISTRI